MSHGRIAASLSLAGLLAFLVPIAAAQQRAGHFDKTYTPRGIPHFTLSNVTGDITVAAWNKKSVSVHAATASPASIEDKVFGNDILITVRQHPASNVTNFEISVPPETSLTLKNVIGKIEVRGVSGDVVVSSFDSEVRLLDMQAATVEVKVTSGDIYFDGRLREGGAYSFQSMKGDIDLNLPGGASFNLAARALSERINLGQFVSSLTDMTRGSKMISGTHLSGGPRLTVTTYDGRIVLHKK